MKRLLISDCSAPAAAALPSASLPVGSQREESRRSRCERARTPAERSAAQISSRSYVRTATTSLQSDLVRRLFIAQSVADRIFIATMTRARGRAGGLAKPVLRQRHDGLRNAYAPSSRAFFVPPLSPDLALAMRPPLLSCLFTLVQVMLLYSL